GKVCRPPTPGGAPSRFRTVLMTALLAILGLMPAALSSGVGSETQRPFAVVIISGLVTAVAGTLFVLPFAYSLIVRKPPRTVTDSDGEMGAEVLAWWGTGALSRSSRSYFFGGCPLRHKAGLR